MIISLENTSFSYYSIGQSEKCIEYATKEEEEALRTNDYYHFCDAVRLKAVNFALLGFFDKADREINRGISIAEKITNFDKKQAIKGSIYQSKANVTYYRYAENEKMENDSLIFYYKKALEEFVLIKDKKERNSHLDFAYYNLADNFISLKNYELAEQYLNQALIISKNTKNTCSEFKVLLNFGRLYYSKADYDKSILYYNETLRKANLYKSPNTIKDAYQGLINCYTELKDQHNLNVYLNKYTKISDSLTKIDTTASAKIALQEISGDKSNSSTKFYLYILIVCALSIFALIYFLFKHFNNYKREKKNANEKDLEISELTLKVNDAFEELIQLAKNNDSCFLARFQEIYPNFYHKLITINSKLVNTELILCAMIYLNFSSKEIAQYTFVQPKTVQVKKYRIRKKLNIPDDEDIYLFLKKL
ncbi:tetratricopeptide repeat protein [Chryseobacterium aquaeductus]|nr:tetratricopeptide repeat protein [Chryseobacterium aquaeductus]